MAKHSVTFGEESAAFSSFWALVRDADFSGRKPSDDQQRQNHRRAAGFLQRMPFEHGGIPAYHRHAHRTEKNHVKVRFAGQVRTGERNFPKTQKTEIRQDD